MLGKLFLVMLGGGLGAAARWGIVSLATLWSPASENRLWMPWGTLAVNTIGCCAIGAAMAFVLTVDEHSLRHATSGSPPWESYQALCKSTDAWKLLAIVGFLGGFTTFSSFGYDTIRLLELGRWTAAIGYVVASNTLGIAGVWAGYTLVRRALAG